MPNARIASLLFNVPLLVLPAKLDAIIYGLQERLGVKVENAPEPSMYLTRVGERREGGYRVVDGVAVIEVYGGLAHHGGFQADSTYILGYQMVSRMFDAALADVDVHTVLFVFDTPGGEVAGVFDLANKIFNARGQKRIVAGVSDMACSAGYLLAAACEEVVVTETACTGSIGVVMRHIDQSKRIEKMGYVITNIFVGDHKVDGNPFEPLPKEVQARYQEICMKFYGMFTLRISTYRDLDIQAVIDTQAKVYVGDESLSVGLIDGIETPDETISRLVSERGGAGSRRTLTGMETNKMSTKEEKPKASEDKPAVTAKASEPVETEKTETTVAAKTESDQSAEITATTEKVDGATLERERIKQIMGCDAAKTNVAQAEHLAYETDMSAEAAIKVLNAGASAVKPAANKLDKAMSNTKQPNVSGDGEQSEMKESDRILSDLNTARGNKQGVKA